MAAAMLGVTPMSPRGALVPARFLALMAHLVLLLLLSTRPPPSSLPAAEFPQEVTWPLGALGGGLALLALEFGGFFSGVSMFHHGQGLLSLGAHAAAALTLTLADLEGWDGATCWIVLALCSIPPALIELLLLISVLGGRRRAA